MTKYIAAIVRNDTAGEALAKGMLTGKPVDSTVYVLGMPDGTALAQLLVDDALEIEADMVPQDLAGACSYVESIGKPDHVNSVTQLLELAHQRIRQIEENNSTRTKPTRR